jgi:hypothetical protein
MLSSAFLISCGGSQGASTNQVEAYKGFWLGGCGLSEAYSPGLSPKLFKYQRAQLVSTQNTSTSITYELSIDYFGDALSDCQAPKNASIKFSPLTFTFDGTTQIGSQTVDKATLSALTAVSITLNNQSPIDISNINPSSVHTFYAVDLVTGGQYGVIEFPANYFQSDQSEKALFRVASTQMFCDDGSGNATVYPTGMSANPCFIKQ